MKKLTKALIPVLLIALIFTLAACGGDNPNAENIIGTWSTKVDVNFGDQFTEGFGEEFADFDGSIKFPILFDFGADGKYKMYTDRAELQKEFDGLFDRLFPFWEGVVGFTFDEDAKNEFREAFDPDEFADSIDDSGKYKVVGDKLYLAEEGGAFGFYYPIEIIPGEKMTVFGPSDDAYIDDFFQYPFELTKVD